MKLMKKIYIVFIILVSVSLATSCKNAAVEIKDTIFKFGENREKSPDAVNVTKQANGDELVSVHIANDEIKTFLLDAIDLEEIYDTEAAINLKLDDKTSFDGISSDIAHYNDGDVELAAGGIYVLSGAINGGCIKIIGDDRTLLVLNGLTIDNVDKDAIISDGSVNIKLLEGSNNIINANSKKTELNAAGTAIAVKGNLSFSGKGNLHILGGFNEAIDCKKKLTFVSGNFDIDGSIDGIKSKKEIVIWDGIYTITTSDDAIKANDNEGSIFIKECKMNVVSGGKAIATDGSFIFAGGDLNLKSKSDCIEGKTCDLLGGSIVIDSEEDGINASDKEQDKKAAQKGVYINITNGILKVDTKLDGLDSNGDLIIEGGFIFISGPTTDTERIIDYNDEVICTGGAMMATGTYAKMQDLGENSSQNHIVIYYENEEIDGKLMLKDENGDMLLAFDPAKPYKAAIITSPNLIEGKTYIVEAGNRRDEVVITKGRTQVYS